MFTDPISIAVGAGTIPILTLTRTGMAPNQSTWYDATNRASLMFKHSNPAGSGNAPSTHYAQFQITKAITLPNGNVQDMTASVSHSLRIPRYMYALADQSDFAFYMHKILGDAEVTYNKYVGFEL